MALTNGWEFLAIDADHAQASDLAPAAEVEQSQADDTDLLVGAGSTTTNEASGVLARADLHIQKSGWLDSDMAGQDC